MTKGIVDLFDRIASIVLTVPEEKLSPFHKDITHRLAYEAWALSENKDYASQFMKVACNNFGVEYHIPKVEEVDEIQGLLKLLVSYSTLAGKHLISTAGPTMQHGIYDHFKGGVYLSRTVGGFASGANEPMVEYLSMTFATPHLRFCSQWNEIVKWPDGDYRSRFVYRSPDLLTPPPAFKVPSPKPFWEGRMGMTS